MDVLTRDIMRCLVSWSYDDNPEFGLRPTYWAVSRKLEVSPKAVKHKLADLTERGVIRRVRAIPDSRIFGLTRTGLLAVMNGGTMARLRVRLPLMDFLESVYIARQFQSLGEASQYDKPADAYFVQLNLLHPDGDVELDRRVELLHAILGEFVEITRVQFHRGKLERPPSDRGVSVLREFLRNPLEDIKVMARRARVTGKSASKYLKDLASADAFVFDPAFDFTKLDALVFAVGVVLEPDQRPSVVAKVKRVLRDNWLAENAGALNLVGITFMVDTMAELDRLWGSMTHDKELDNAVLTFSPEYLDNQARAPYLSALP